MKKDEDEAGGCIIIIICLMVIFGLVYESCPGMIGSAVGRYEKAKKDAMQE